MGATQSGKHTGVWGEGEDGAGKGVIKCEVCTESDKEGRGWERQGTVAETQNMARHALRIALVLWLSGQHLNRLCIWGEATK
jgi:hypothetical protein